MKGFAIRLQPFPPNTLGFAGILDLIVEWLYIKIDAKNGGKYGGVRIKKEGVSFFESTIHGYRHIIACIFTKSCDMVFIENQVREIHKIHVNNPNLKQQQIAEMFEITQECVSMILNGKRWYSIYEEFDIKDH